MRRTITEEDVCKTIPLSLFYIYNCNKELVESTCEIITFLLHNALKYNALFHTQVSILHNHK